MEWGWAFDGVNTTIPRNAGPECSQYLTYRRQIIESITVTCICIFVLKWVWRRLHPCLDPYELHAGVGGGLAKAGRGGYFGSTAPPPLNVQSESDKSALLFNNNNNSEDTNNNNLNCDGEVHFSVNSGYCVNTAAHTDSPYQKQLRRPNAELEGAISPCTEIRAASDKILMGKQVLLVLMTFVLGLELGFKFASRTVIYLLNPCHITTLMQVSVGGNH